MNVLDILEQTRQQLAARLPGLACDYFPENPDDYRLLHDVGALLLSYTSTTFGGTDALGIVVQPQPVRLTVTVVIRQLNGKSGAVAALDALRQIIGGWRPDGCATPFILVDEKFLGRTDGLWQYALTVQAGAIFVQSDPDPNSVFTEATKNELPV